MKPYIRIIIFLLSTLFVSTSSKAQWVADFTATISANGCGVATYNFSSTVTNNGVPQSPATLYYHWDFGNGTNTGSQQELGTTLSGGFPISSPSRSYLSPGIYSVLLRVYSTPPPPAFPTDSRLLAQVTKQVIVYTTPTPDFTADITEVCVGDPVTFTDIANYGAQPFVGNVLSRRWNMGNGNFFDITDPNQTTFTYTYPVPGDYQVTLTTRTFGGRPGEECVGIRQRPAYIRVRHRPQASFTINPVPPACSFPYAPSVTNTSTIASTPPPAGSITSYVWRFYNGPDNTFPQLPFSPITTLTNAPPSIPPNAYNAPGTYAITLEAISSTGCRDIATRIFTINAAQTADFNLPNTNQICSGSTVQFTNASSPGAVSFSWNFPGGTPATSTQANPNVTFATSGMYNVTLDVTYPDGCVRSVTKPYNVTVVSPPDANFTNTPTDGFCFTPKNVTFIPLQAQNPNYTYTWNFGENIGPGLTGPIATGYSLSNIYEQFGTYNVQLTVRDNITGCETTVTRVLTLVDPELSIVPRNPRIGCAPLTVNFDISMNAIEPIAQYRIDYDGDGTYEVTASPTHTPPTPFTALVNYTYTTRGNYIPAIEITTINGCVKRVTSPVPIKVGTPPQITSFSQTGGAGGCQGSGITFTPVFAPGFEADSIVYSFSDGGTPVSVTNSPFNVSRLFTQNGTQGFTATAFFNGCPISVPFNYSVPGGIQSPIPSLQVVGGIPDVCTGTPTNNQVCVNISGTLPSPTSPTIYVVNFGDGNTQTFSSASSPATLSNICNTYLNPGTYTITLTATGNNGMGCVATAQRTITISPDASVNVDFTISPNPAISCSANQVSFASTSTITAPGITISQYIWNFGDGSPIVTLPHPVGANTTHTYSPSNTLYNPTLTLVLSNGCTKAYSGAVKTVNIQGPNININATPSLSGCTGVPINFAGVANIVPNSNSIVSWEWDFGDPASGINNTASGQNASHIFNTAGSYTVTLRVRDNNTLQSGSPSAPGCIATRTVTVQIFNRPTASFTINRTTACVGSPVSFTSSTNAGGTATYFWDFGDGNTSTVANPTHTYAAPVVPGTSTTYNVSLTVTNTVGGCSRTVSQNFTVTNVDFDIRANGSNSGITVNCPPQAVSFTSSFIPSNVDPTGWTFNWQFGDGNQANSQNATNEYNAPTAPRQFDVIFTATNTATGCSIVRTLTNFVTITGPRGTFSFTPANLCKPDMVTFTATNFTGNPTQIIWDFGDGSATQTQTITSGETSKTITHTYTTSGSFLPNITLVDGSVPSCRVAYPSPGGVRVNVSGYPNANFTWTGGGQICRNVVVNFQDLSTPDPQTGPVMNPQVNRWSWTIYDGDNGPNQPGPDNPVLFTSSDQNPSFTFTTAKTYLVRLQVRTAFNQGGVPDGCPAEIEKFITIVDPTIVASIISVTPFDRCPNEPVLFTGQANTNVNPKNLLGVWNVYQNPAGVTTPSTAGPLVATFNATVTPNPDPAPWGMTGNYAFSSSGIYTIELVVTDAAFCTGGAVATQVVNVDPLPTFVSGPTNQSICVGGTATFTAQPSAASLAAPGVTYQWQFSDDGGMTWFNVVNGATLGGAVYAGATTDMLTITNGSLPLNGYRYRLAITKQNTTQCVGVSSVAGLTVSQVATTAVVNPSVINLCNGTTATLNGNTPTVGTGRWAKISGPPGGAITDELNPVTTVTGLQFGTYVYRWEITSGACPSSFADVTITNSQPANAGTNQNLCNAGSFTLTGNNPALSGGGTGQWILVSGPSTVTFAPNDASPNVTVNGVIASPTPYIFRWTITGAAGCGTTNANVQVLNSPLPTVTNPAPQTVCAGQNATFSVTGGALNYQWQVDDGSGSGFVDISNGVNYSGATTQTLTVINPTVLGFNGNRYRVRVTNPTTTCTNVSNDAQLIVLPNNTETISVLGANPICLGDNVTIRLSTTKIGYSYQLRVGATPVSGVPILTGDGNAQNFAAFAPTATATYNVLIVSPTFNGVSCSQQLSSTVTVVVNQPPSTSFAGANFEVCGTTATLNASVPTTGTGFWTVLEGTATIAPAQLTNPNATVTNISLGTNRLRWRVTNGVCPPSDSEVIITGKPVGVPADAGPDQTICANPMPTSATLAGNNPGTTGTGTWTRISGGATIDNPSQFNTTVSGLTLGANTFRWTVLDQCTNVTTFDEVTINVQNPVVPPSSIAPINLCGTNNTTITASAPINGTGLWTVVSGSGVFGNNTNPVTTVSGLANGANVFRWTVSNACGSEFTEVTVTVNPLGSPANAGPDQRLCINTATTTNLNATLPVNGIGQWTRILGGATITNSASNTTSVTNLTAGLNRFRWTVTDACGNTSNDDVDIFLDAAPTPANAGANQTLCAVNNATLAANTVNASNGETGTWVIISGTGIFSPNNNTPNATVTGLSNGNNVFEWRITNSCGTSSSQVTINVVPPPPVANAGPDQTFCGGTTILAATPPPMGSTGQWTIISQPAGPPPIIVDSSNPNSVVTNLQVGTTVLRWTVSNSTGGVCPTTFDEVSITSQNSNVFAYAGPNVIQCGNTVTLTANTPAAGTNHYWILAPGTTLVSGTLGVPGGANGTPTITVTGLQLGSNVFRWTVGYIGTGCSSAISDVDITRVENTTPANAGPNQTVCQTIGSVTLNGNTPTIGSGTWSVVSVPTGANLADINFVNPNLPNTVATGFNVVGNYVLRWEISNGACTPSSSTVQITVTAPPTTANAGTDQVICADNTTLNGNIITTGQGTWTVVSAPSGAGTITFGNANLHNTTASGFTVAGDYILRWTSRNGTACNPSESQVRITRLASPTVSNAGANQTICATSFVLNGNTPAVGTGTWSVVAPMGATVTFSNINSPTATANGLTVNGDYTFTWTISNGICGSSASSVTITVNAPPTTATVGATQNVCGSTTSLTGNSPIVGIGTWTVIAGGATVDFPNQFNSTVSGLTPGVNRFRWTITNGTCPASSADLLVNSFAPPSTANAGANSLVCSADGFLNAVAPTAGTGTWTLVSGSGVIVNPNSPTTQVTGLGLGDNVFRWTVTNGVCPSAGNFSDVTLTRRGSVSLSVAGVSETICGSTYNLNANVPNVAAGETGTWSVIGGATIAPADINNPNAVATNLAVGFNIFTWTVTNGCATSVSSIVITRNDNVTPANAGTDQTVCTPTAQLSANQPTVGTGQWTLVAGSGVFANSSLFNTTVSGLSIGVNTFRWTISSPNCTPSFDEVTIIREEPPTPSFAGINQTICADNTTLNATPVTVGTGTWTVVSGTGSVVSPNSPISQVINLSLGTNILRWTTSNGTCPVSTSEVIITREAPPSTAFAGADQSTCNTTFTLAANTPAVGTGVWTITAGSGVVTNPNSPTSTVTGLGLGINTFTWTVTNGSCPPSVSSVNITRVEAANTATVGTNQVTCLTTANLTGNVPNAGSTGTWTVTAGGATVTDPSNPTSGVTGLTIGVNTFRWRISNTCGFTDAFLTITRESPPTTATVGTNQTTCATTWNALSGNTPISGTGTWTVTAGTATVTDVNNPNSGVTGLSLGVNTFRWTIANSCGSSFAEVSIIREQPATVATVGTNQVVCSDVFPALSGNVPLIGTGQWTVTAGGATVTDPSNPNSGVTGLTVGINTFRWRIANSCGFTDAFVTITRQEAPTVANAGTNQSICATSTTLNGNVPMVGTGTWSLASAPSGFTGTVTFNNANQPNATVSGLTQAGDYTFTWTISNGICTPSQANVTISVIPTTFTANAGANQNLCGVTSTTLAGNTATGATGTWTQISGSLASITDINLANTTVTGLTVGTYVFRWTLTGGSCSPSSSDVTIRIAEPANAGPDQTLCAVTTTTLAGNTAVVGTGTWTQVGGAAATISNINSPTPTITGLNTGTYTFRWTISGSPCGTTSDDVVINVVGELSAGANQVLCNITSTTLAATAPVVGTGTWTVSPNAGVTIAAPNSPTSTVTGLTIGTVYTFTWTITGTPCILTPQSMTVTVAPNANAGLDQNLCNVTTTTLSGNTPLGGAIGTWTQIGGASATINNQNSPNTTVTGLTSGTYTFRWTISGGGCATSFDDVIVVVSTPANAGLDQNLCGVGITSTTLAATAPITGTGTWTKVSGPAGEMFANINSPTTTVSGLTNGTYIFQWEVTGGTCPTTSDQMTILVSSPADAGADIDACNVTTVTLNAIPPTTGAGAWTQISGPSTANFSGNVANATVTNLQTGTYVFRWTITGSACTPSTDDVIVRIAENANAGPDQNICNTTTATLAGNTPISGIGTWTQISGNPVNITNQNSPNTTITGLTTGTYVFEWTFSGGTCGVSSDQVTINVSPTVSAGANQNLCGAVSTILNASNPIAGTGTWSQISGPAIASISNINIPNPTVSGLQAGTYVFRWTITGTPCPNLFSEVTIVNANVPNAGSNQTICFGNALTMNAQPQIIGTGTWSQVSGPSTANFVNPSANNTTVTNLTVGTYVFRWTVAGTVCPQNNNDVTITVVGVSTANANASISDSEYCDNQVPPSVPITVSSTQNGVRYELRNQSGAVVASQTGTGSSITFNLSPAPTTTSTYTVFAIPNTSSITCNAVELQDKAVITVKVCEKQTIGLAKTVLPLSIQDDGSINVTYLLTVRNMGNTELTNIQVTDDLTTVFPAPATYRIVSPPSATGVLLANTGYTGTALNPNLLTGLGRLSAGETQTISFVVNVIPNAISGTYTNTAVARGERGNVVVTDRSTDGVNVDPDNDGDPSESTPTVFTLPPNLARPRIGIAKNVFSTVRQADGSYNVTYQMTIRNYGNVELTNVQIVDDLNVTFPSPAQFSIVGAPSATGNLTANASYTGTGANNLVVSGGKLAAGESQNVVFTVNLIPNTTSNITYRNTATARGQSGTVTVTDNSADGINPDPNGDGNPTEESPTPLTLPVDNTNNRPLIGVAKTITNVVRQGDGTYNVTYQITVRNYGNVELTNVQITEDLNATFPSPAQFRVVGTPAATGNLIANAGFTGTGSNANLLNGGNLAVRESQTVSFTVNLTPNAATASYRNTAVGSGQNGTNRVTDASTDGFNPDPNGDDTPDENIPTVLSIPADSPRIGVAKTLLSAVRQANGSFNLTYLISVRNYGNVALSNVQVTDNLLNTFPSPAQFSVVIPPSATGNLVGNTGFTGTGSNINLLSSGTLGIGERQSISFTVNLIPNATTASFRNTAVGSAQDPTGRPTTDTSTDGLNPDPNNDGNPVEESPTIFNLPIIDSGRPFLGVAKNLVTPVRQADGSYNFTYQITVRNYGNTEITNLQVTDDLTSTFPSPAQFRVIGAPIATGNLISNANYTGRAGNSNLLSGGRLSIGESQTISFTVNVIPNTTSSAVYRNTAIGSGLAGNTPVTDTSTEGTNPDPNGDGNPSEDTPTAFVLSPESPVTPVPTRFVFTTDNCANTILTEKIILQNVGLVRITPLPNTVTLLRGVVSISADGTMIYRPALNAVGLDSLEYEVCNSFNQCAKGRIVINVLACTSKPPIVRPDEFGTDNCTELTGNILTNDEDPNKTQMKAKVVLNGLTQSGGVYSISADGRFNYLPPKGFVGRDSLVYEACNSSSPLSKCGTAKIYVDVLACEEIFIPEGFSPNGDGINDVFVIKGAERYDIKLQIFNRWGNLIYEDEHYKNTWNAIATVGILIGEGVPDGTYYYIVDLRNGQKPRVGFMTIQR